MSPPRLTLDVTPLLETQWTGIPVFTRRLARALAGAGVELDYAVRLFRVPSEAVERALEQGTGSFLRLLQERPAVEAAPLDPSRPMLYPSVKPVGGVVPREASVVHDLSTLVMPETHAPANVAHHLDPLRETLLTDEVVFCCSEATRTALVQTFPFVAPKARLLLQHADWPASFALIERNLPPVEIGRYAVVIGTVEARKNLGLLLRALDHPALAASGLRFVVIGRRGHGAEPLLARLSPAAQERVTFTGFVSEFVKYRLLKYAEFLVLPSVYEGFGIPAVEAMSLGKPVLAAMSSSFPEVIGEAGVFFDAFSVEEFAAALSEIADSRKLAELAPKALAQAASFGPERMAAPVLDWLKG